MTVLMLGLTRKRGAVEEGEQVFAERTNVWQSGPVPPKFYSWLFTTRKGWFFKRRGRPIFQISPRDFITSILWFCWIFQWMLTEDWKGMSLFVKGIQGISSSCPILMKQSKVISRQGSCFSPILDMSPFVEHVGSVQLLSKNKTARDILTQEVFVFLVRFVHTCISLFCHLCLLLLCLWSHVIHVAQPKMTDWHLEGLAFCTFLSTTSVVHRFSSKF